MTARGRCPLRCNILAVTPWETRRSISVPIVTAEAFSWERRRALSDFLVFSNVMYAAIGAVYAVKGRPVVAVLVTLSGLTSFVYHVSRETVACARSLARWPAKPALARPGFIRPPPTACTGVADQVIASVAFLSSVSLLRCVPTRVVAAEAALVVAAFVCKYWFQSERSVVRFGGAGYWAPHCMWHLLVAIGQAMLAASLPDDNEQVV